MEHNLPFFIKYDFMLKEMDLSGTESDVYALIYSYTVNDKVCFTSVGHIADRLNVSERTVRRLLKSLVEKEYILRCGESDFQTNIYIANIEIAKKSLKAYYEKIWDTDTDGQDVQTEIEEKVGDFCTICPGGEENSSPNNKDIKTTTTTTTTSFSNSYEIAEILYELSRMSFEELTLVKCGKKRIVNVTLKQRDILKKYMGISAFNSYVLKLEDQIEVHNGRFAKMHFATMLRWFYEDVKIC
ncbi:MAG: helix-turn-helix domain-containing protein [Clostridia bacterium]|nr:helix-turn-helix domain-containing protein [Clostridia bacterium]